MTVVDIESIPRSRRRYATSSNDNRSLNSYVDIDIYNDNGEEIEDIQYDFENIKDDINEYDYSQDVVGVVEEEEQEVTSVKKKKLIECSASIMLPFSEDVAFDAFSDLTRQPSWCKYLHSVSYIGLVNGEEDESTTNNDNIIPLRQSKWTVGIKGLRFSWTANDTRIVRPNIIEWESTSGLKNMGSVEFTPQGERLTSTSTSSSTTETEMKICFTFVTPRVVSSLFRRSGMIRQYTEDVLLGNMLTDFRDVILAEILDEENLK